MADKNIKFKDKQGNYLFPQTKIGNVIGADGNPVDFDSFVTAEQLQEAIAGVDSLEIIPVETLPSVAEAKPKAIYLVPATTTDAGNLFLEYMLINGAWELIGTAGIDLSGYVTTDELSKDYYDKNTVDQKLSEVSGDIQYEEV